MSQENVLELLKHSKIAMTCKEIADKLGYSRQAAKNNLTILVEDGDIKFRKIKGKLSICYYIPNNNEPQIDKRKTISISREYEPPAKPILYRRDIITCVGKEAEQE